MSDPSDDDSPDSQDSSDSQPAPSSGAEVVFATVDIHIAVFAAGTAPTPQTRASVNVDAFKRFDDVVKIIRIMQSYKKLSRSDRALVEKIIANARRSVLREYYLEKLGQLLSTPDASPEEVSAENSAELSQSIDSERQRQDSLRNADPANAAREMNKEETASADPSRRWTTLTGGPDATGKAKTFRADRRDVRNIFIQIKVHLRGEPAAVRAVEFVEDAIEKYAGVPGYSVDVVFVHPPGDPNRNDQPDVFEVNATTEGWTNSVTWGADASALTHELHHLLGLDDRYDYIEAHAKNSHMKMPERLQWFDVQMWKNRHHRPEAPSAQWDPEASQSVMGDGKVPLDSDICSVIQARNKKKCEEQRGAQSCPSGPPSWAPPSGP
jgi:hypothetical protein